MTPGLPQLPDVSMAGVVFAVIRYDGPEQDRAAGVVVAFESEPVADQFARDAGLVDYQVAPIGFHISNPALR